MNEDRFLEIMFDIFPPSLPQLGPGDRASTRRALEILYGPDLPRAGRPAGVLDIGCGNGRQTLRLAAELDCPVLATDIHQPFLDEADRRAAAAGVGHLVETRKADMADLGLGDRRFDLVWAEGSVSIMGMREALTAWRDLVEPGGALGLSELTWFTPDAPAECREFLLAEYPPMVDEEANLAFFAETGWDVVDHFRLPQTSWQDAYYAPVAERLAGLTAPPGDEEYARVLEMIRAEITNYARYNKHYGYTFFLARSR